MIELEVSSEKVGRYPTLYYAGDPEHEMLWEHISTHFMNSVSVIEDKPANRRKLEQMAGLHGIKLKFLV